MKLTCFGGPIAGQKVRYRGGDDRFEHYGVDPETCLLTRSVYRFERYPRMRFVYDGVSGVSPDPDEVKSALRNMASEAMNGRP